MTTENVRLPRVLIVSMNPLRADQSNGIMMRSLFEGWPRERLGAVYFPVANVWPPDLSVCGDHRQIRPWGAVGRVVGGPTREVDPVACEDVDADRSETGDEDGEGRVDCEAARSEAACSEAGEPRTAPWLRRVVSNVTRRPMLARWTTRMLELWYVRSGLDRRLQEQIAEFRPDLVYALLGSYSLTRMVCAACERTKTPLYLHVTDDFVTSKYLLPPLGREFRAASLAWFARAVAYSSGRAGPSPTMAAEYAQRHGREWDWFTTLVDSRTYDTKPPEASAVRTLVYAGNLELERWKTLRALAQQLAALGDRAPTRLRIYSTPAQLAEHREALSASNVELMGWLAPNRLPQAMQAADLLVHVESFDPLVSQYTRLSLSTKLSQYMMAGRCILSVGPDGIGSTEIVRMADAGVTICRSNLAEATSTLRAVLADEQARRRHGENGRRFAMEWFESRQARERFREALCAAAAPPALLKLRDGPSSQPEA